MPRAAPWVASVAMTSSASYPAAVTPGTARESHTWWMRLTCPTKSAGVSARPALYSAYWVCRKVGVGRSQATATWVGRSSRSTLINIEVKP